VLQVVTDYAASGIRGIFYRSSLLLGISLRLVPTLSTCPAWETLLVAMLPPA